MDFVLGLWHNLGFLARPSLLKVAFGDWYLHCDPGWYQIKSLDEEKCFCLSDCNVMMELHYLVFNSIMDKSVDQQQQQQQQLKLILSFRLKGWFNWFISRYCLANLFSCSYPQCFWECFTWMNIFYEWMFYMDEYFTWMNVLHRWMFNMDGVHNWKISATATASCAAETNFQG